jgi:YidC/Oxa1 family membrane protein insertase
MFAFLGVFVAAAYHIVSASASILAPLLGGLAAAAAIVLVTVAVRLILMPLSYRAMRGMDAQARVAPLVQALQRKHAGHPDRLQRELTALYQAEGTGMFAGCLPLLAQWPVLSVMTLLFRSAKVGGTANSLLTHDLFGASLGSHWLGGAGPLSAQGAVFAGLFLLIAGVGWLSARMAPRLGTPGLASAAATPAAAPRGPAQTPGRAGPSADQASRISAGLARLIPYATVILAAFLPLAAGLYLLTTTAWTLGERILLRRAVGVAGRRPRGWQGGAPGGGGVAPGVAGWRRSRRPGRGAGEPTPRGGGRRGAADAAGKHRRPAGSPALQTGAGSVMQSKR